MSMCVWGFFSLYRYFNYLNYFTLYFNFIIMIDLKSHKQICKAVSHIRSINVHIS